MESWYKDSSAETPQGNCPFFPQFFLNFKLLRDFFCPFAVERLFLGNYSIVMFMPPWQLEPKKNVLIHRIVCQPMSVFQHPFPLQKTTGFYLLGFFHIKKFLLLLSCQWIREKMLGEVCLWFRQFWQEDIKSAVNREHKQHGQNK